MMFCGLQYNSSRAFLVLLGASYGKVDRLKFQGSMHDVASFYCLASGILSGLVRDVSLSGSDVHTITLPQMLALSQCLSLTNALERLSVTGNLSLPGVSEALVDGFEGNTTLERLDLILTKRIDAATLPRLFMSPQNHPTLRHLELTSIEAWCSRNVERFLLWLESVDCKLESVKLCGSLDCLTSNFGFHPGKIRKPNISLRSLSVTAMDRRGSFSTAILPNLRNLTTLELCGCVKFNLEPLAVVLLGDSCRLETLILSHIHIG